MLQIEQQDNVMQAMDLFLQTQIAFAHIESNGVRVDQVYLDQAIRDVCRKMEEISVKIKKTDIWRVWYEIYGDKAEFTVRNQLAKVLFCDVRSGDPEIDRKFKPHPKNLGYHCTTVTPTGAPDTSELALKHIPEVKDYIEDYTKWMSLQKTLKTSLYNIRDNIDCNGFIHPSFSLFSVVTYRTSCLSAGTMIFADYNGELVSKPIEYIREGDMVYCCDDSLNLTTSRVMWAGKTGHKSVVRLLYICDGVEGYIDVTPEHRIRLQDGSYVRADSLTYKHKGIGFGYDTLLHGVTFINSVQLIEEVDVYDITLGEYHNFFANGICVHNSSNPNFQNFPKRDPELASIVRPCFIPRSPDRHLVEIDYSGAEVRVNASINNDPTLKASLFDGIDFHKSVAATAYLLPEEEITKQLRQSVKGPFTFAAFYGSYWVGIADGLWNVIMFDNLTLKDGTPLIEHLRSKGITKLGNRERPEPDSYYAHIKKAEEWFWNVKFKVYNEWKKDNWDSYQENGYVDLMTGFRCGGVFSRNFVNNAVAQGSAAHCLLWSLCKTDKWLRENGFKACVWGQIHDSMLLDIPHDELDIVLKKVHHIMTKELPQTFRWLSVPMEAEADVAPMGASWWDMKPYEIPVD